MTQERRSRQVSPQVASGDRVISAMLIPVVRLLIRHGHGMGEFFQAAKRAYIEAAIIEFVPSGGRPNASLLSVVTGLTRKDVAALLKARQRKRPYAAKRSMQQRALRVLQGWQLDPRFLKNSGRPDALRFAEGPKSFVKLVRKYGGDVTPVAVLSELERMGAVRRRKPGTLNFVRSSRRRYPNSEVVELAQLLEDFAESVASRGVMPPFRGFREALLKSPDQVNLFKRTFARRGVALLDSVADWAASQNDEQGSEGVTPTRVGLGVYIVEKPDRLSSRHRRSV